MRTISKLASAAAALLLIAGCSTAPLADALVTGAELDASAVETSDDAVFPTTATLFPNPDCNLRVSQVWGEPVETAIESYVIPDVHQSRLIQQVLVYQTAEEAAAMLDGVKTVFMTGCDEVGDFLTAVYMAEAGGLPTGYDGFGWMVMAEGKDPEACDAEDKAIRQSDYWLAVKGERAYITRTEFRTCESTGEHDIATPEVVKLGEKAVAQLPVG